MVQVNLLPLLSVSDYLTSWYKTVYVSPRFLYFPTCKFNLCHSTWEYLLLYNTHSLLGFCWAPGLNPESHKLTVCCVQNYIFSWVLNLLNISFTEHLIFLLEGSIKDLLFLACSYFMKYVLTGFLCKLDRVSLFNLSSYESFPIPLTTFHPVLLLLYITAGNSLILIKAESALLICSWIFQRLRNRYLWIQPHRFVMNHRDTGQCWSPSIQSLEAGVMRSRPSLKKGFWFPKKRR